MSVKRTIKINRFDNQESRLANSYYNFLPTEVLDNSMGVEEATFPYNTSGGSEYKLDFNTNSIESVKGVNYFKQYFSNNGLTVHRLLVYSNDKKVYINQMYTEDAGLYSLYNMTFDAPPITLAFKQNDADAIILADGNSMKIWKTNYTPYTINEAPIITSMCIQDGVLFCTVKEPAFKVWYCTDLNAENIGYISSNSGYIPLEDELGSSRKVVSFDDAVYAFRDYGITKINFYKKTWSASQVYQSNTKIFTNTVSVCGNMILFATSDGLYQFGGSKVTKLKINLGGMKLSSLQHATASSLANKYFLACRIEYNDRLSVNEQTGINNVILYINTEDLSVGIIRGVDVKSFLPIKTDTYERMYLVFNSGTCNKIGQLISRGKCFNKKQSKSWTSYIISADKNDKLFTRLEAKCGLGVCIRIHYDGKTKDLVSYKDGYNSFTFRLQAKEVFLEINSTNDKVKVENISLDYYEE